MTKDENYGKRPSDAAKELMNFLMENPDNIKKLTLGEVIALVDKGKFSLDVNLDLVSSTLFFKLIQKKTDKELLK